VIPLVDVGVRDVDEDRTKQYCFELFPLTGDKVKASKPAPGDLGKWIDGHHTVYRMSATSEDDRKDWIRALRIGSQNLPPKQR
jgi:cytohesin